jgi:hypothetical protein
MRVFQNPDTGTYIREDGKPGYACARCGNGYATAATRDDLAAHMCTGLDTDFDAFSEAKGLLCEGYTAEDIDALNTNIHTVEFRCLWDYRDGLGFGGDSEIIGREINPDASTGPWKALNAPFADWLDNSHSETDLDALNSMLDEEDYEVQDFSTFPAVSGPNVARKNLP